MCGRYQLKDPKRQYEIEFSIKGPVPNSKPRVNFSPTNHGPFITAEHQMRVGHWGLIPAWSKVGKMERPAFNARSDTVRELPTFRSAFKSRRCLVPMDAFYEWSGPKTGRIPHEIKRKDGKPLALPESSRKNANDRLPRAPLGRVEGGDGIVEGRDVADVRPRSSVPHPLDDLTQLGAIGLDDEVDRQAVGGPCFGRPGDGHQRSSGSNQACGPLPDVAPKHIENQIDSAAVFQGVIVEVDKLLRAEVERRLTVGSASGADDVGAGLTCELRHHRPDYAGRAVHKHPLPCPKAAVLEQCLPRGQARHRHAHPHREA